MLVLTRKKDESIIIGDDIEIVITNIQEDRVKIGIVAPKNLKIYRKELIEAVEKQNISSLKIKKPNIDIAKKLIVKEKEK